jgi:hypothetical protein
MRANLAMASLILPIIERIDCNVRLALGTPPRKNRRLLANRAVIHVGARCYSLIEVNDGRQYVKKVFIRSIDGRRSFDNERLARTEFAGHDWMTPCVELGRNWCLQNWIMCPMYPPETRLDRVAFSLSRPERRRIAGQAVAIIYEIYRRGFAHRDFHSRNLFYLDGRLKLIDFETITTFPSEKRPPFIESYDVTGSGLESPYMTGHMCYGSRIPYSVANVLGIGIAEAIDSYCNCA